MPAPLRLARTAYGTATARPALVIAPGLFGHGRNWGTLARRLSDGRQVVTVDLRNHGDSPWSEDHSYPALAADLAALLAELGAPCDLLGHSMGGKAAMVLALRRPELLRRLIVADIAPVAYDHSQLPLVRAMQRIGTDFPSRAAAEAALAALVDEAPVRSFLLQSLDLKAHRWKLNLSALAAAMPQITGFPAPEPGPGGGAGGRFEGPSLFLTGAASPYVRPEHHPAIRALFPQAQFQDIPGAGHWLHAEKPRETEAAVRAFLDG